MRAPLTPIKAFVHDTEQLGVAGISSADDPLLPHWLAVAQAAARLAALLPAHREEYVRALGQQVLPARTARPTQIEGDGRSPTDTVGQLAERLRLEAEDMERAGCFEMALVTVSAVCHMLARGAASSRLLATAHLGRVNRQMGELDAATDCYRTVTEDGEAAGDGPVAAHGFIGLGNVAHARGNRPAQIGFFEEALKRAVKGSALELSAHQGLMVAANALRLWADALLHGWRAHDLAPPGSDVQLEIVGNLAITAFEAGFYQAALNGHEYVIQRTSVARIRLPAISNATRAAAKVGNRDAVQRFEHLGGTVVNASQPLDVARFLLHIGESWHLLGEHESAKRTLSKASRLAEQFGFHEIAIRAEELLAANAITSARPEPSTRAPYTDEIMRDGIGRLEALATA